MNSTSLKPDRTHIAIIVIVITVFSLALGDALIKQVSTGLTLWQIFVLRSLMVIPVLIGILQYRYRSAGLLPAAPWWTTLRSVMLTTMWIIYYVALPHVALSVAAAAFYTLPLFITLFSSLFVHERIRLQGWIAIVTGFIGVLLILRPSATEFNFFALLPLLSAVLYALSMIITRTKCREEHPLILSLSLNSVMVIMGCAGSMAVLFSGEIQSGNAFVTGHWHAMQASAWLVIGVLSLAILIGSIGTAFAYQNAPSSLVATFDFAYVAFATLMGFLLFAETPDSVTWIGMALITAAGVLAVRAKAGE